MKHFDQIVRWLARVGIGLAAIALLASLALIVYSVVMRYGLNQPIAWVDELVGYLLVACVMLASADALLHGEHIAVDIVTERLSARGKQWTLRMGLLAVLVSAVLLAVEGWDMVAFARMVGLLSNGYLAVPMWIPQALVPIGASLLGLAAFVALIDTCRGQRPASPIEPPKSLGLE
ncbi:MAG: TRAP transporter small permease [Betaproteobacteria bacterium]|nr:TRAP transporter small permease [Betaproteobacteria bacterium]